MTAQLMPTMTVTGSVSLTEMRAISTDNCSSGDYHHCTHHSINSYSLQNEDSSYVSTLILIEVTTLHFRCLEVH